MTIFGSPEIERMAEEQDLEGLLKFLEHRDMLVRLQAAQALADLGEGAGWRFLMDTVRQQGDMQMRITAVTMLGELADPRVVPLLSEELQKLRYTPSAEAFSAALRNALEAIGTREAEEALRQSGYEPVLLVQSHTVIEFEPHYAHPVAPRTDNIIFLTHEQHLNNAVELREAELAERGLVENNLALWLSPDWGYAWYVRGVLFEDLERNFEAWLAYKRALELDPNLADAQAALHELETEHEQPAIEPLHSLANLGSRDWEIRRDSAAWLGDQARRGEIQPPEAIDALTALLDDEEREVRHVAIESLGRMKAAAALPALRKLEESSWLARFAILQAIAQIRSVDGLVAVLRREMTRIQERNPVFSSRKDPLVEVEYESLMEIGVRALEYTGDIEALLRLADTFPVEETGQPAVEGGDVEEPAILEETWSVLAGSADEEEESEEDEELENYVDEVAQMVAIALERLAMPQLPALSPEILQRLASVPDLTLIDLSGEQPETRTFWDLSALRQAAQETYLRRLGAGK